MVRWDVPQGGGMPHVYVGRSMGSWSVPLLGGTDDSNNLVILDIPYVHVHAMIKLQIPGTHADVLTRTSIKFLQTVAMVTR